MPERHHPPAIERWLVLLAESWGRPPALAAFGIHLSGSRTSPTSGDQYRRPRYSPLEGRSGLSAWWRLVMAGLPGLRRKLQARWARGRGLGDADLEEGNEIYFSSASQ